MDFLKQVAKGLVLVLAVDFGMVAFGVDASSVKFRLVSALVTFGAMFFFLYNYMDFIGIMESFATPGLDTSNPTPCAVWKVLGGVCFVIALICIIAW